MNIQKDYDSDPAGLSYSMEISNGNAVVYVSFNGGTSVVTKTVWLEDLSQSDQGAIVQGVAALHAAALAKVVATDF